MRASDAATYRDFDLHGTFSMGVPESLERDQQYMHTIYIAFYDDFHGVCPVCNVPLSPKLR